MSEVHPYISEGFGEDFVPGNYDMKVIDHFEQVTDKDGAIMARRHQPNHRFGTSQSDAHENKKKARHG